MFCTDDTWIDIPIFCCRHGKTTLLNHIANRALRIPPNIDVLICEQGNNTYICVIGNS